MTSTDRLEQAFAVRALPRGAIGLFGDDVPPALLADHGLRGVCVRYAPLPVAPQPQVQAIAERFLDPRAAEFLHRLAGGDFDGLAGIVFCRDDTAALTAYQYATELRRQGLLAETAPPFFLWNLLHTDSAPVRAFNAVQLCRLRDWLAGFSGEPLAHPPATATLWDAQRAARITGRDAMVWRNAGRWMAPHDHAAALATVPLTPPRPGRRIALLGGACDLPAWYDAIETAGTITCDLTLLGGEVIRGPGIDDIAADPLHPRSVPAGRHRPAMVQAIVAAGCDLAVAQLDETDDTFGWDLPSLRHDLGARGIPLISLGFRPIRPDATTCARAADHLRQGVPA